MVPVVQAEDLDDDSKRCAHCFNSPCLLSQGLYESIVRYYEDTLCNGSEGGDDVLTSKQIRFRLYRHATSWIHGYLGRGKRIELPVCVRGEIMDLAPADPGTQYVGFKDGQESVKL
jgi:hypothetical protein